MGNRLRVLGECRIDIGIDVGWSKLKRSCALAVRGLDWDDPCVRSYRSPNGDLAAQVKLFRLEELVKFLPDLVAVLRDHFGRTTLVVDGPLGADGRPRHNRSVDAMCRRGDFYQRMQPNDVTGESGRKYVEATYRLVDPFLESAGVSPWVGRESRVDRLIVAETNPTVAMALSLPMQVRDSLPSRNRPIALQPRQGRTRGRVIWAKSDWYWLIGSGRFIAEVLGSEEVAQEDDHDRVAGLFCLGMAAMLKTGDPGATRAVPIGSVDPRRSDSGVYVVPRAMPDCWRPAVESVGVPWSNPVYEPTGTVSLPRSSRLLPQRASAMAQGGQATTRELIEPAEDEGAEDQEERFLLLLNDNGGVWTTSNGWLKGLEPDVSLRALDGKREVLTLRPSAQFDRSGQWKIVTRPKTLALANARGFTGGHLSGERCVSVDVEILAVGVNTCPSTHEDRGEQ